LTSSYWRQQWSELWLKGRTFIFY